MINLTQYAQQIETGLNDLVDNSIRFVVWSDIGKYKQGARQGNSVTRYINCLLTRAPGQINTGNSGLIIASDSITLQVAVPTDPPRATVLEDNPEVNMDVYEFVEKIRNVMDAYFSQNIINGYTDENGKTYQTGMQYSLSATGNTDLAPIIGTYITFSVYITVNIVQNGINSREVKIYIDGEEVPFLTASPNRASVKATDVYAGSNESETVVTSTAFIVEISQPATTGRIADQFNEYLLYGAPNIAHFAEIVMGERERRMLVTFGDISSSVEGVMNVGLVMPLIPVRFSELISYPSYMAHTIAMLSGESMVSVKPNCDCLIDIGGSVHKARSGETTTLEFTLDDCEYVDNNYILYILYCPTDGTDIADAKLTVIAEPIQEQANA